MKMSQRLDNPFHANAPFQYPLKTEKPGFSDDFRGYRNGTQALNGFRNFIKYKQ